MSSNSEAWNKLANHIFEPDDPTNEKTYSHFGNSVSISGDGKRMIIGEPNHNREVSKGGGVGRILTYQWNTANSQWESFNSNYIINGFHIVDTFGYSVAMSQSGNHILVGAPSKGLDFQMLVVK